MQSFMQGTPATKKGAINSSKKEESQKIFHIAFDASGVLMKDNKSAFLDKVGVWNVASYSMSHFKNPIDTCINAVNHICSVEGQKPSKQFVFMKKEMPQCLVEWHQGKTDWQKATKDLRSHIDALWKKEYFSSKQEYDIVVQTLDIALNPENLGDIVYFDTAMIKLMKDLKKKGHHLYLLTNMSSEAYQTLEKKFSEEFSLFSGSCISSSCGNLKPEKQLFETFLSRYNVAAADCIFIDDEKEHAHAATQAGMHGIHHTQIKKLRANLHKIGAL